MWPFVALVELSASVVDPASMYFAPLALLNDYSLHALAVQPCAVAVLTNDTYSIEYTDTKF